MQDDLRLSSTGQNPCGPLVANRDRDRRPCEGFSGASATRPVANARTAPRQNRGVDARSAPSGADFSLWILARSNIENLKTEVPTTNCATYCQRRSAPLNGYAMISCSRGLRTEFLFVLREARRSTTMMAADRSTLSCRAFFFLLISIGIPRAAHSATLEDSAKELAWKVAAALPPHETVSLEIQNISSLRMEQTARVEGALKSELQGRGIVVSSNGATSSVAVTLSENFKSLVWTAEIHGHDTSHVVLIAVERSMENRAFSITMPVTIRSEKFWEGPERILDAEEISDGVGKSWLVLLLPVGLRIQERPTGSTSMIELTSNQSASRDPWGNLGLGQPGNTIAFFLAPQTCTVNLETRSLAECQATEGGPASGRLFPMMIDLTPPGPLPPGKGTQIAMGSVCGGANHFFATGARDYTQTDSLQVFQADPSGPVAVSTELDFPGPITALHAGSGAPRAVVRNLITGNYEAYRLSISCAP